MEYAKDIILNVRYKSEEEVRNNLYRIRKFLIKFIDILKICTGITINTIKNNKIIFSVGMVLITLIVADFVLIDKFFKLYITLF